MKDYLERRNEYWAKGKVIKMNNRNSQIETKYCRSELPASIPRIKDYDAMNIDYDQNILAFFNTTPEQLELMVNKIK